MFELVAKIRDHVSYRISTQMRMLFDFLFIFGESFGCFTFTVIFSGNTLSIAQLARTPGYSLVLLPTFVVSICNCGR